MKTLLLSAAFATLAFAPAALAEDHEIQMLTTGSDGGRMVFEPAYLEVAPGDTVTFVATDPTHNAQTARGMLPEGAEGFRGAMNQDVSFTPDVEGVYGVVCQPHYGMGMVAVIKVGDGPAPNLEEARAARHPGRARDRFAELLDQAEADQAAGAEATR